jgi:hypothetical protein
VKWLLALLAACGDNVASIDAAVIDTRLAEPAACETYEIASCLDGLARVTIESFDGCAVSVAREQACTCSVEFARMNLGERSAPSLDLAILCDETPTMFAGSSCGPTLCLPTRAELAPDGTVERQRYIVCGEETCIPRPPPVIANYGARCTPADYDEREPSRAACLVVGAQTGASEYCIGDWECPQGMLCDDRIAMRPVCKPGPRGVLTAEMLSP